MLDEPTAGVSPIVMDELFDRIIEVARTGIPILMVEQNARQALKLPIVGMSWFRGAMLLDLAKNYWPIPKCANRFGGYAYGFYQRSCCSDELCFDPRHRLWRTAGAWGAWGDIDLWNFTVFQLCPWRYDGLWHDDHGFGDMVVPIYGHIIWPSSHSTFGPAL